MDPVISIIIPVYNVREWVRECLESILGHGDVPCEVLVVDDGSTDGSGEIVQACAADKRLRCFRQDNRGQSAARNRAIAEARGSHIWFVDSDDRIVKGSLSRIHERLCRQDRPRTLIVGSHDFDSTITGPSYPLRPSGRNHRALEDYLSGRLRYVAWNKLVLRQTLLDHGIRFPEGRRMEEIPFFVQYFARQQTFEVLEGADAYAYRNRPGSTLSAGGIRNIRDTEWTFQEARTELAKLGLETRYRVGLSVLAANLVNARFTELSRHRCNGEVKESIRRLRRFYLRSVLHFPPAALTGLGFLARAHLRTQRSILRASFRREEVAA